MFGIVEQFLKYLHDCNKSDLTIRTYRRVCNQFLSWIQENYGIAKDNLRDVRHKHIVDFLNSLIEQGITIKTRNKDLNVLKSFFKWLHNEVEIIENIPTDDIKNIKIPKRVPHWFSVPDTNRLYHALGHTNYKRNKAILMCLVLTGVRRCEVVRLNLNDVADSKLHVIGKGNKERWLDMSEVLYEAINDYLKVRPKSESSALFLSQKTKDRMSPNDINNFLSRAEKRAGLKTGVHILRHTAASQIYAKTHDIYMIKEILGHESLETTKIYTHVDNPSRKEALNSNPLNTVFK